MAIVWHNIYYNDANNVSIGVDWQAVVGDTEVRILPVIYRWDRIDTDNYGGRFNEYLSPDPSGDGEWLNIAWGSGSGERVVDSFEFERTYERKEYPQTVSLTISWNENFGTCYNYGYGDAFYTIGSGSHTWTYTIPALDSYTVAYDANGGRGTMSASTAKYNEYFITKQNAFTRDGYKFVGWNEKADGTGVVWSLNADGTYEYGKPWKWTYTKSITLYAQWEIETYNIVFVANGGIKPPASQVKTYGENLILASDVPVREGYNFLGWATSEIKANAGTVEYESGAVYTDNSHIKLYAVWESKYTTPTISNFELTRCDELGNDYAAGKYVKVSFDWTTDTELYLKRYIIKSSDGNYIYALNDLSEQESSGSVSVIVNDYTFVPYEKYEIRVEITDSENAKASVNHILEKEVYIHPEISNLKAVRTGEDRVKNEDGECGLITFDWSIDKMWDGSNSVSNITVAYQEHGTGGYPNVVEVEYDANVDSSSATAFVPNNVLSSGKSYDFVVSVEDKVSSVTKYTIITYSFCTMDFRAGGKGIALGRHSYEDIFDVDMSTKFRKEVEINGRKYGENQIMLECDVYMNENQERQFIDGKKVSDQPNGIVLVFSYYDKDNKTVKDHSWSCHFVPKIMVELNNGGAHTFLMAYNATMATFGAKHLKISDTGITGNDANDDTNDAHCGITYSNDHYVLRYVIGV